MPAHDRIHAFLTAVRARLEQARMLRLFTVTLVAVGLGLLCWCLLWVLQGYAVPRAGYGVAALVFCFVMMVGWLSRRTPFEKAAAIADVLFGLKDGLTSYLGFDRGDTHGEFHRLHAEQTAQRVGSLNPGSIPLVWSRGLVACAVVLLGTSALLGSLSPSLAVQERLLAEGETAVKTDEINKELEKQVEELLSQASPDEKEMLHPDEWRKWVKELQQTKDPREALRQYAELENKLQEAVQKLSQREQEQLLSKAAEELKQDPELRETARKMEEKDYRAAAADLQKLQAKADVEKPDEARKELAKLRSAAQRMAAAARQQQQHSGKSGQEGSASGSAGSPSSSSMDQQMVSLDSAAQQYDKSLSQKAGSSECKAAQQALNQKLAGLCQSMGQCATKRDLTKKLASLCQSCSKCQGFLCDKQSMSLSQCLSAKSGGKGIGAATVESRRNESDPTMDNGNRDQLQGIKGSGPSDSSVESADSGTGVTSRQVKVTEREWQRQMESFIQREDVPAQVKQGVKEYFKGIQQVGP